MHRVYSQSSRLASRSALRPSSLLSPVRQPQQLKRSPTIQIRPSQSRLSAARFYSAEAVESKDKEGNSSVAETKNDDPPAAAESAEAKLQKDLEAKNREIVELKDKYLRSVADFRNLQERTRREVQAARDFALQKFARDLLDSVDNLDRALATVPTDSLSGDSPNADLVALHGGLRMTEDILMGTLKKHGLERFDPAAETARFDPNVHEAVFQTPQQGKEDGTVFHTQQKGFMLNGRVLRAAKVGVVKNS